MTYVVLGRANCCTASLPRVIRCGVTQWASSRLLGSHLTILQPLTGATSVTVQAGTSLTSILTLQPNRKPQRVKTGVLARHPKRKALPIHNNRASTIDNFTGIMDPLSVIASSIAIAGAVSAGLEAVRTIHNAGGELHSLMNEVSEITILLGEVERAILERRRHQQLPQWTINNISKILLGAKSQLHELDAVVNHRLIRSVTPSGEANVARLAWLRQKSKVQRLQMGLRQTRLSLASLWGAANL